MNPTVRQLANKWNPQSPVLGGDEGSPAVRGMAPASSKFTAPPTRPVASAAVSVSAAGLGATQSASASHRSPAPFQPIQVPSKPAGIAGPSSSSVNPAARFSVRLLNAGNNKIMAIKEVRAAGRLGLKEAKDLVESAPAVVCRGLTGESAKGLVERLRQTAAAAELIPE